MVVGSNSIICWNNVKTFLIYQCYVSKLAGVHTSIIDEYFCLNVSLVNSVWIELILLEGQNVPNGIGVTMT